MSIECKTEFHKNYASNNMQYTYMFLFFSISHTNYRLQKHKWDLSICPEAALRIQNEEHRWHVSTPVQRYRPRQLLEVCSKEKTHKHVHTRSHSHTWNSHLNIKGWDEKKQKNNNNFQRASEGFGCLFVFLRLVSFFFQTVQSLWSLVLVMLHSYTDSNKKGKKKNRTKHSLQW